MAPDSVSHWRANSLTFHCSLEVWIRASQAALSLFHSGSQRFAARSPPHQDHLAGNQLWRLEAPAPDRDNLVLMAPYHLAMR